MTPIEQSAQVQVAAYYFPNWHPSPLNAQRYGEGQSEWKLVKEAAPRFPGHQQPKVPSWGYEDESDPVVFTRKIDAAANHGIDCFIFDWYWSEQNEQEATVTPQGLVHGPSLHGALENGYLHANNNDRVKFAIMWANHWPVSGGGFKQIIDDVVAKYFRHPAHWMIDNHPYFSIYDLNMLANGLGGLEQTKSALAYFRTVTKQAGFPDLHLNVVAGGEIRKRWGFQSLPGDTVAERNMILSRLRVDSITSYVWLHSIDLPQFPTNQYATVAEKAYDDWNKFTAEFDAPYHPNVTMGWDSWPRVHADEPFALGAYPRHPLISDNSPEEFRKALQTAKQFFDTQNPPQKILTINAWNEWTEGSYLEPDTLNGMGYLEAIRDVFPPKQDQAIVRTLGNGQQDVGGT